MRIRKWQNTVKDIADYPFGVKESGESIMANAVNACNYDLLALVQPKQSVLEIGCGSNSWLKNNLQSSVSWDGIDVFDIDSRGRKCIATKLGSVHAIPFCNNSFDWVLANQSMEHWFEYDVKMDVALSEIARVLKDGGQAHLNFPFYLHGHPFFVQGDLNSILSMVNKSVWRVVDIIAYQDSGEEDYPGWRRCGFPDSYVQKLHQVDSSFVVNLILEKKTSKKDLHPENPGSREVSIKPHISPIRMALTHGVYVLFWKSFRKLTKGRSGI